MKSTRILLAGAIALAFASPSSFAGDSGKVRVHFSKCPIFPPNCVAGTLTIAPWRLPDDND